MRRKRFTGVFSLPLSPMENPNVFPRLPPGVEMTADGCMCFDNSVSVSLTISRSLWGNEHEDSVIL